MDGETFAYASQQLVSLKVHFWFSCRNSAWETYLSDTMML